MLITKTMKRKFLFLLSFVYYTLICQNIDLPIDSITNKVTYTGVVVVQGASKELLFSQSREWLSTAFTDSKEVIQYED